MKAAHLLIALLLSAAAAVDLVAWSEAGPANWPAASTLLLISLAFSQLALAAIWVGLGGGVLSWRLAGLVVVAVAWSFGLSATGAGGAAEHLGLLLGEALVILACVSFLRAKGWRLDGGAQKEEPLPRPLQFSLGDLLSWITSTAVVLGLLRSGFRPEIFWHGAEFWSAIAWIAAGQAATAVAALAMVFGSRPLWMRASGLAASAAFSLLAFEQATKGPEAANVLLCLLYLLGLLAGLVVIRVAGYSLSHSVSSLPIS